MKISKDDADTIIEFYNFAKLHEFEMKHFLDYVTQNYGAEITDSFKSALWLGISDSAHYELFFDELQKARLEHGQ